MWEIFQNPYRSLTTTAQACFWGMISVGAMGLFPTMVDPAQAAQGPYCRFESRAIAEKNTLREKALAGDQRALKSYGELLQRHRQELATCRQNNWPRNQAVWLRLYECDTRPGNLEAILDDLVHRGYNQVNVEVFFNSQVMLPASDNDTPWQSMLQAPQNRDRDFLAEIIKKGRTRGLKVYAWMFTLNFGYDYSRNPRYQSVLARNGRNQISTEVVENYTEAFIDPYNYQAQYDYYHLVEAIIDRQPDGILFDYVRYPRSTGTESVIDSVKDLWIYSPASLNALRNRAQNGQGRELIQRFVTKGAISPQDVADVEKLYPRDLTPLWEGRVPVPGERSLSVGDRTQQLTLDLWYLAIAHAAQGVLDFVNLAHLPADRANVPSGVVFFPGGNQEVGQRGFDSRLQPWDSFPGDMEWNPMAYGVCGTTRCIEDQVRRTVSYAPFNTKVAPAIAGVWGRSHNNRPSLEAQMAAIQRVAPQIETVSHFAYSWQEPEADRRRKFCRV